METESQLIVEDIIWKQLMNIEKANELLKINSIQKHPNYNNILKNYNKGVETIFNNIANMRDIKIN